jgi:antitoxin MazE
MSAAEPFETYLTFQRRGVVTLPSEVRKRLGVDQPGTQIHLVEVRPGVFEIHGVVPVPADQAWFWSERWQQMEAEADTDVAAGRVSRYESVDDLLESLDG